MLNNDIDLEKNILRKQYKAKRKEMSEQQRENKSLLISDFLLSFDSFKQNDMMFCYVPLPFEINTYNIIDKALKLGKKVAVPRCLKDEPLMDFYFIKSFNDLENGSYNIPEPKTYCEKCLANRGVIVIPALSFDLRGFRLGYGKGYYDRFLNSFKGTKVGLCYSEFLNDNLPHDKFDEKTDYIITEKGIIEVK